MHTLIAELYATGYGIGHTRVVFPNGDIYYYAKLRDAEKFCFARGATTIASFVGKPGYLRASRYAKDSTAQRSYGTTAQSVPYVPVPGSNN